VRLQPGSRTWMMRCPALQLQRTAAREQVLVLVLQHAPARQQCWRTRMTTPHRQSQKQK
jgi:hypothetical protein